MTKPFASICATVLATAALAFAGEAPIKTKQPTSTEFERLKSLVGTWKGTADIGQGPVEMTVNYRLLAGGTVLEERVFEGTPNEMVTMFYERGGKLALTHYCMIGNQPGMLLGTSDSKTMSFDFDKNCGVTPTETHMHSLKLTFDSPDQLTMSCKLSVEGKTQEEHPTTLKRIALR